MVSSIERLSVLFLLGTKNKNKCIITLDSEKREIKKYLILNT